MCVRVKKMQVRAAALAHARYQYRVPLESRRQKRIDISGPDTHISWWFWRKVLNHHEQHQGSNPLAAWVYVETLEFLDG